MFGFVGRVRNCPSVIGVDYVIRECLALTGFALKDISAEFLCSIHTVLVVERFNALFPRFNVELVDLFDTDFTWINRDIEALRLVNVFLALCSLVDNRHLGYLGEGFEDLFFFVRQTIEMLHTAVFTCDTVPDFPLVFSFFREDGLEVSVFLG